MIISLYIGNLYVYVNITFVYNYFLFYVISNIANNKKKTISNSNIYEFF